MFTHYYGHSLNLAASDSIKSPELMRHALDVIYFTILQLNQLSLSTRVHHVITQQCWCMHVYMIQYTGIIMVVSVYMVQLHVVYQVPTPPSQLLWQGSDANA